MAEAKGEREYLGFADAADVEWRVKKERDGRIAWTKRWGDFLKIHEYLSFQNLMKPILCFDLNFCAK